MSRKEIASARIEEGVGNVEATRSMVSIYR
jgi:hypothetical protein